MRILQITVILFLSTYAAANSFPPAGSNYNNFPTIENPISQGGWWINGGTVGLDWQNVKVVAGGKAECTGISTTTNDCTAVLAGTWGPNQTAQFTVIAIAGYHNENEIRLNTTITAHSNTGYEFNCSNTYQQIVRWNGALGNFDVLVDDHTHSCQNGAVFKATSVVQANGSVQLTAFINGVQVNTVNDNTAGKFTNGSPGMGMFVTTGFSIDDSGLTNFTATDGMGNSNWASAPIITNPGRATDWTKAGISGGPPTTWSNCTNTQCNTAFSTPTVANINSALANAPAQTVVRIPAGSFTFSTSIFTNRSNVLLRGAGPTQTLLNMTSGANIFFGATGSGGGGGEPALAATNITSGMTIGSSVIGVASTSGLTVGTQVGIDQLNDTSIVFTLGSDGTLPGVNRNGTTNFDGNMTRTQHQISEIKAVCTGNNVPAGFGCTAANQLAIDPPLMWTLQSGLTPQVYSWTPRNVQFVGIENLKVDANGTQNAVNFSFCSYCWAKNIEVRNGAHTEVHFYFNYRSELRDSYLSEPNLGGGPTQYGVELADSTLVKVENNILFNITSGVLPATTAGLVVGYNYALNTASGAEFGDFEPHAVHNMFHLYEGNTIDSMAIDNVWGSHSQTTLFRNRSTGKGLNKINFRTPLSISAHQRYINLIGNVFGAAGYHTVYQKDDTNDSPPGSDVFIYQIGFFNRWDFNQTPYDTVTKTSLFRWGNYDTVNAATRFVTSEVPTTDPTFPNAVPASQTLPASFYLSSKPAWFGNVIFPPIGPDVTCTTNCIANVASHAAKNPAQLCYESTAKDASGYLTAFDAAICYAGSTGPIVQALPNPLSFGNVALNTTSAPQAITLSNPGTEAYTVTGFSLSGSDFAFSSTTCSNTPFTMVIGASCTISLTFTPSALGSRTGTFTFLTSAGNPVVSLTGTGVQPAATLSPSSLDFSTQRVGTTSGSQPLTLTNSGTAALAVSLISITGTNSNQYSQTNNCPASLSPSAFCTINVSFSPTSTGSKSASVSISDNAPGSPHTSLLSGTGTEPVVSLSSLSVNCGSAPVGASVACSAVTLTNTGTATLNIASILMGGINASDFSRTTTCGSTLSSGANCIITPSFAPLAGSTRFASIVISDDAPGSPHSISLTGSVPQPSAPAVTLFAQFSKLTPMEGH